MEALTNLKARSPHARRRAQLLAWAAGHLISTSGCGLAGPWAGTWTGRADGGGSVRIEVDGNVADVVIDAEARCLGNGGNRFTFPCEARIQANGDFSCESELDTRESRTGDATIEGSFEDDEVTGTIDGIVNSIFAPGYNTYCDAPFGGDWSAEREGGDDDDDGDDDDGDDDDGDDDDGDDDDDSRSAD